MSQPPTRYEMIASDCYWAGSQEMPPVPFASQAAHEVGQAMAYLGLMEGSTRKAERFYNRASGSLYLPREIPLGTELSTAVIGETSLIKVIEDYRRVYGQDSRARGQHWGITDTPEEFEELTRRMFNEGLYNGARAGMIIKDQDPYQTVRIARSVAYLVGSNNNTLLAGIDSTELSQSFPPKLGKVMPADLAVGQPYKKNRTGTETMKVISAQLIMTGRSKRAKHKRYRSMGSQHSVGIHLNPSPA